MNETAREYTNSTTRNVNCYSNIPSYGASGKINKILPPTPATVSPAMFDPMFYYLKAHAPPNPHPRGTMVMQANHPPPRGKPTQVHFHHIQKCNQDAPYATMKNMCDGQRLRGPQK